MKNKKRFNIFRPRKNKCKSDVKSRVKTAFIALLSFFWILPILLTNSAVAFFGAEKFIGNEIFGCNTDICAEIQNKFNSTIDNIMLVAKAYPHQSETIGITGGNIINFKNQMSDFIKNQVGITDSFAIADMVKSNEKLYRFLIDKRNNLNLSQKRSLEDLSEGDLYYLQKLNAILVNYFKTQAPEGVSPELTQATPELRTIAATLYCFTSDEDLKDASAFFDNILLKVSVNRHTDVFTRCMKDVLDSQITSCPVKTSQNKQNVPKTENKKQAIRVAVIGDDDLDIDGLISCAKATAKDKGISAQSISEGKKSIYIVCPKDSSNENYIIKFTTFSGTNWIEDTPENSGKTELLSKNYYPLVFFAFDADKYKTEKTDDKDNNPLSRIPSKLKDLAPRSEVIAIPVKNTSDAGDCIFQNIYNFIAHENKYESNLCTKLNSGSAKSD